MKTASAVTNKSNDRATRLGVWFFVVASCWTILIVVLAVWDYWEGCSAALAIARFTAGDSIDKDLLYRRWAGVHSGVMPAAAETRPNSHLAQVPEPGIATPAAEKPTLMNPARMTRQGRELGEPRQGERGHITSLRPLDPENAPDEWEKAALLAFERGKKEVWSLELLGSDHYFRLMRPLVVERECLKCHAAQGYKVGDVRGGLSVSVPWASSQEALDSHIPMLLMAYGGVWGIGIVGLYVFHRRVQHHLSDLKQSEERHRVLFDQSRDAMMTIAAPSWRFTAGNAAALELFGVRTADELLALGPRDFSPTRQPDGRPSAEKAQEMIETALRKGSHFFEWTHQRLDGKPIHCTVLMTRMCVAGQVFLQGTVRDVSAIKQAEEACQESERKYRRIFDSFLDLYFQTDMEGTILNVSPSVLMLSGWSPEEVIGRSTLSLYANPQERERLRERLSRNGRVTDYELTLRKKDDSLVTVSLCGRLVHDGQGRPIGVEGTMRDISERKRVENELKRTVAALESANKELEEVNQIAESATRAKSEFLANMSHEIRTPMTAILGFAEVLLGEPGIDRAPPERIDAIRTIQRNGQHLLKLINDILDLSKIEAGKLDVERITCSPAQVLADVIALMRIRADEKNLSLQVQYDGGIPESIHSDPLRLRQVLINLVGNAIKFTETGNVRLVARLVQRLDKPALLQIDVIDTGIGLSQAEMTKLFRPFNQADSSTTRKFGGTGLGLTISKRLAEMLGGDITISSVPGQGSTFSVTLETGDLEGVKLLEAPIEAAVPSKPARFEAAAAAVRLDCRILLAEDGPDNQRLIRFLLEKAGAGVTGVENGQLAVKQASIAWEHGQPFDVILMDMQMPVMDGYTATRQLRQRGYTGPIVALTAHAMAEDRQKCLEAGCNDHVTKPIDRQEFLTTVAHWAARTGTSGDSPKSTTTQSNTSAPMLTAFVYSDLAADPDLGELVEMFVQEMPDRINALETQARSRDWQQLTRIAHQLKGAAGSYGFKAITPYAARLESAAREGRQEEDILSALDELLDLCRRVRSDAPPAEEEPLPDMRSESP